MNPTRRSILATILSVPPILLLGPVSAIAEGPKALLDLTPTCAGSGEPTVSQSAGPFYRPSAPLKRDLARDAPDGEPIMLGGFVLDTSCRPVPGALVEIWHADEEGVYDNVGFRLRGHQLTDEAGRWGFDTIVTQHYSFRTAHYHVRVQRPGGPVLTTELYFPNHPRNRTDPLFDPRLILSLANQHGLKFGRFDFVV